MNAISTLTVLPTSKTDIEKYVNLIKEDILSGYINPLETALMLKSCEDIVKALRADEEIKQCIELEADKYSEKTIEFRGAKIGKSDKTTWDFSNCEDSIYNDLTSRINQLTAEKKGREMWLKTIKTPTVDQSTGELINPPATTHQSILSITLKK